MCTPHARRALLSPPADACGHVLGPRGGIAFLPRSRLALGRACSRVYLQPPLCRREVKRSGQRPSGPLLLAGRGLPVMPRASPAAAAPLSADARRGQPRAASPLPAGYCSFCSSGIARRARTSPPAVPRGARPPVLGGRAG